MTRLKGMPSQMLAIVTATSEWFSLSHQTESMPKTPMSRLTTPESASNIHCQVVADTMIGSSQGTRNSARSKAESGKFRWKNTASASPITYWKNSDTTTNVTVC